MQQGSRGYPSCECIGRSESIPCSHKGSTHIVRCGRSRIREQGKDENPNEKALRQFHKKSGLPLRKFFNTSGLLYREMELSKKIPDMSEDEMFKLLASDGMLVKRPLLITKDNVLTGFKEEDWKEALK